jgi:hypothetical protein
MIARLPIWCCFWVLSPGVQDQAPPEEVVQVALRPSAAPVPALKYQFLPEVRDQIPGNAVIYYSRAAQVAGKRLQFGPEEEASKWLELPAKDWPREKVRSLVHSEQNVFRELELAARCDHCDWQLREGMRKDALGLLLPELQKLREFTSLLRLRAGLQIVDGRFDEAVHTLRVGFAMAKHAGQSSILIGTLVGVSVAGQMADQVIDLLQSSGAPNLYWALTDLPRPFIELRTALQSERFLAYSLVPPLADAGLDIRTTPLSVQQLQERLEQVMGFSPYQRTGSRLFLIAVTAKAYPEAKRFLLAQGLKPETVEAMPRLQAVFLFSLAEYDRIYDEIVKWQGLPYWQASKGLEKAMDAVREEKIKAGEFERIPLAAYLIPSVQRVFLVTTQLDRKIAALRSIEAIRLYAAGHDGKLPAALSEITEGPVPMDPVTGKEFDYKVEDGKAILSAPPPAGEQPRFGNYLKYELTLAK